MKIWFYTIAVFSMLTLVAASPSAHCQTQQTNKRYSNRYSVRLIPQKDGSFKVDNKTMQLLGGESPEGFFEPYKPESFIPAETIADVPCEEVVYKTYPDRKLVLYISKALNADGPTPLFCYIHGGGWKNGHPKGFVPKLKYIAKYTGLAAVSVQYSVIGQTDVDISVTMKDLHDAVQFLRDHAAEYNLDMTRIAFAGHSAGGHLSAMMAMTEPDAKVLSGWAGPYDMARLLEYWSGGSKPDVRHYFFDCKPRMLRKYSPVCLVPKKRQVAVQLFQGTCDGLVHYSQAQDFEKALKKAGQKTVECNIYPYYGHGLTGGSDKAGECFFKFIDFVKEHIYD